jgi:hypothetical protein
VRVWRAIFGPSGELILLPSGSARNDPLNNTDTDAKFAGDLVDASAVLPQLADVSQTLWRVAAAQALDHLSWREGAPAATALLRSFSRSHDEFCASIGFVG